MATYTDNYLLKKPASSENVLVSDINDNMDIIDEVLDQAVNGRTEIWISRSEYDALTSYGNHLYYVYD